MMGFVVSRLLRSVLTLLVVVSVVFFATRMSGNAIDFIAPEGLDPESREALIRYFGLHESLFTQYLRFLGGLMNGEAGISLYERRPVTEIYGEKLGSTLILFWSAFLLSVVIGVPAGIVAALKRRSVAGTAIMAGAFLGYATPNFVLAIFLILVFSFQLHWFPSSGNASAWHFVMPTVALASALLAQQVRFTRNSMLETLSQDYMRTARAKGLSEWIVIGKHGFRNALIPIVTVIGLQVAGMVAQVVIIEAVFATKGVGDELVAATIARDYPVLQFGVIMIAALVVGVSFLIDLLYAAIDPRIRVADS